jgi:hypothetical protein
MREANLLSDLVFTITYADDTQDICTITEDNLSTWSSYQQPKTVDRNQDIMGMAKTLKAWLLSIGAKSITLEPPIVPP